MEFFQNSYYGKSMDTTVVAITPYCRYSMEIANHSELFRALLSFKKFVQNTGAAGGEFGLFIPNSQL
jgi:hypothetical protein